LRRLNKKESCAAGGEEKKIKKYFSNAATSFKYLRLLIQSSTKEKTLKNL
jgi:hypothetical protein